MSKQFNRLLENLEKRVHDLQENVKGMNKSEVMRQLNVCSAFLNNLSTQAIIQGIDLDAFRGRMSDVHTGLIEIQEELERLPWYKHVFKAIRKVLRVVCDLLGYPNLGDLLDPPDDTPLLLY